RNDHDIARYRGSAAVSVQADQHITSEIALMLIVDAAFAPVVTTSSATNVTAISGTLNGSVNPNGYGATAHFEWGATTAYGSTTPDQAVGAGNTVLPVS